MANEFIIKNGFHSKGNSEITGSLTGTPGTINEFTSSYAMTTAQADEAGIVSIDGKKDSAGTIAKGLPVYLVGYDSDLHTVELADANNASKMPVIGFTSEPFNSTDGKGITTFGKLEGVDTTSTVSQLNPNGETWVVNDVLYISTNTGGLTKVRPTGSGSFIQRVAKVLKVDATGGQIFIFNTARTAGLPNLTTDNVWVGDANGYPQMVNKSTLAGDSIYTADGTIGSGRIATLTDTVTYKGIGTSLGQRNLIITDSNNDYILENYDNGYFKRTIRSGSNLGVIQNAGSTQGLWLQTVSELAGAGGLLIKNAKADTNYLKYFTDNFKAPDAQWYSNGQIHHRIRSNGTSSTVLSQVSFFTQGFYGFGFNVGASAPIGTEDISLQGETLISEKLELSTTTDGMLMPRLTTAQMNAISSPDTHLVIFNTDLSALYRYNGSAWVALSAGYGIVSTTDSAGNPTFYATVKAAYDAGAGSIKLHTDYEETTSNPINIVNGRNIDLNGFTYTYNVADSTSIFEDNTANNSIRITNGRLIRKNGTGGDHVINCNLIQTRMDLINVYAENENGACLNVRTTFNGSGSEFYSNNTSGIGFSFSTGSVVSFGKYVNKSNADTSFLGAKIKFAEFVCEGSGKNTIGGNIFNSRFIANSGRALLTGLTGTKIYDCYLESSTSNALDIRNSSEVYNSTLVSNAAVAVNTVGTTATKMKGCIVQGSHSVYSVNALSLIEDCIIVNSGAGKGIEANATTQIINNIIKLESGTADGIDLNTNVNSLVSGNKIFVNDPTATGIVSANVDIYIVDNKIKGTTLGVNLGTGTNLWIATTDAQGNSVQL